MRIGVEPGTEFSEGCAVFPAGAVDELAARDLVNGLGEANRWQERGEWMGPAAGIAAFRGMDRVAGGYGAGDERLPVALGG